jgi:hypothetical protein
MAALDFIGSPPGAPEAGRVPRWVGERPDDRHPASRFPYPTHFLRGYANPAAGREEKCNKEANVRLFYQDSFS